MGDELIVNTFLSKLWFFYKALGHLALLLLHERGVFATRKSKCAK